VTAPRNGHGANGTASWANEGPGLSLPAQDLEAEFGVIGSILDDNSLIPAVEKILAPRDFWRDDHATLFGSILDVYRREGSVDAIMLRDELQRRGLIERMGGGEIFRELLTDCMNSIPHAANGAYYAGIVRNKSLLRAFDEAMEAGSRDSRAGLYSFEDLASRVIDRLEALGLPPRLRGADAEVPTWPTLADEAKYGLAGEIVQVIAPHTEADPAAILVQLLVAFGSMIGPNAHWRVGPTRHGMNLFACIVGNSSKARKGTSWDHVLQLLGACQPNAKAGDSGQLHAEMSKWEDRIVSGLSSGEGVISAVKDGNGKERRLMIVETEFGGTLGVMGRDGNTLSAILRDAWDNKKLQQLTKHNPVEATGAHISLVGHITGDELARRLSANDAANGFANRFLWVCARRSKYLPDGGSLHLEDFEYGRSRLARAAEFASREPMVLLFDPEARAAWWKEYPVLSEDRVGTYGVITNRAEAQTIRLAGLYALLDGTPLVGVDHLKAALALWRYCDQSAAYIFGQSLGDKDLDKLMRALREKGAQGMTRNQINRLFAGHKSSEEVAEMLGKLAGRGLITPPVKEKTGGRSRSVWTITQAPPRSDRP
jgi:hypothetical protein